MRFSPDWHGVTGVESTLLTVLTIDSKLRRGVIGGVFVWSIERFQHVLGAEGRRIHVALGSGALGLSAVFVMLRSRVRWGGLDVVERERSPREVVVLRRRRLLRRSLPPIVSAPSGGSPFRNVGRGGFGVGYLRRMSWVTQSLSTPGLPEGAGAVAACRV